MSDQCDNDDQQTNTIPAEQAIVSPLSADSAPAGLLSPISTHKRVDSFTCSCSSAGDGSCTDGGLSSPLDADEMPQSVLSVDMFSRFATAYTYPIDGEDDSDSEGSSSSNSGNAEKRGQSTRSQSAYSLFGEKILENEDEDKSCENDDTTTPATRKVIDSKLNSADTDSVALANRRVHRRVTSLDTNVATAAARTPERKICSSPSEGNLLKKSIDSTFSHTLVTPSPPQKKQFSHRRSRSMPIADLSSRYDKSASSSELKMSPQQSSHRRILSAHSPLGDMMKLTSVSSNIVSSVSPPCPCPRAGLPPRPNGGSGRSTPVLTKLSSPSYMYEATQPSSHRRVHSAPGNPSPKEGGQPAMNVMRASNMPAVPHLRSASYGSFKEIRDACESLYMSQNSSPDPKLLGQRKRHQRGHSLDSRTTRSTDSNKSSPSEEESNAAQYWSAYYEKQKLKKHVVKDELKYRLGKAVPKALTSRLSSRPELKRAGSAKFC